jgi:hypothetical protein
MTVHVYSHRSTTKLDMAVIFTLYFQQKDNYLPTRVHKLWEAPNSLDTMELFCECRLTIKNTTGL